MSNYLSIECEFKYYDERKEYLLISDGDKDCFIPNDLINNLELSRIKKGDMIIIDVEEWFIIEKELDNIVL